MANLWKMCVYVCLWSLTAAAAPGKTRGQIDAELDEMQSQARREHWTFTYGHTEALESPVERITGLKTPANWKKEATFFSLPPRRDALPSKLDWREKAGGLTPVKHQGQCGSCWAFGTVGVMESVIKIRDHVTRDISEQHVVSCNNKGYSCSGGWAAHFMHMDPGAVYTRDFPYYAQDVECKSGLEAHEKIVTWGNVGSASKAPTDDEIKRALNEYGPLSTTMCVGSPFQSYQSGVYNRCDACTMTNGHLVVLVGYNDEEGYWIVRNSWGSKWGEEGYFKYKYGCETFNTMVTFVNYKPSCTPQPIAFTGEDRAISRGEKVRLGGMPVVGQTYHWTPAETLEHPEMAMPLASPTEDTTYKLSVTNSCGTAEKSVTVRVSGREKTASR